MNFDALSLTHEEEANLLVPDAEPATAVGPPPDALLLTFGDAMRETLHLCGAPVRPRPGWVRARHTPRSRR